MKTKAGKTAIAICILGVLVSFAVIYAVRFRSAGAVQQVLADAGKFKLGSALGMERAGFSGQPMVLVFANPDSPDWPSLSACLQSPEVEAEMALFTGILVDERFEPGVEAVLRERDGFRVVVRGLSGAFLGGLKDGSDCLTLSSLLKSIRERSISPPVKSPIYTRLLENPDPIDALLFNGERAKAEKFVGFLKEFEGEKSPAAIQAQARLSQ